MKDQAIVVFVTVPSSEVGAAIARAIVGDQLAACANIVPGLRSIYRWKGEVHDDAEALLVIKSRAGRYQALEARIKAEHPYEVPEIISWPIERGLPAYLDWVAEMTA